MKPSVDGEKVANPIQVHGETNGKAVQIHVCGHNLCGIAKVEGGKFIADMPTFPTGQFQLEAWVDGEYVSAIKIEVTA